MLLLPQGVISAETVAEGAGAGGPGFPGIRARTAGCPSLLLRLLNLPPPGAVELARAAEVFQEVGAGN